MAGSSPTAKTGKCRVGSDSLIGWCRGATQGLARLRAGHLPSRVDDGEEIAELRPQRRSRFAHARLSGEHIQIPIDGPLDQRVQFRIMESAPPFGEVNGNFGLSGGS